MKTEQIVNPSTLIGKIIVSVPRQWLVASQKLSFPLATAKIVDYWVKPYSKYPSLNERRTGMWVRLATGEVKPVFLRGEAAFNHIVTPNGA